ncbi:MAG TPA: PA2778 family cysteine peptidase [Gammaproteobacteria bacterium]
MSNSRYTRLLLVAGVCSIVLLAGCATPRQTAALRHSPPPVVPHIELETVPFFPQERFQCGPAALATVLAEQGLAVTPEQLEPEVYLPQRHGSLQVELVAAARNRGRIAYPLAAPELDHLLIEVAAGHPVLVMQNLGVNWLPQWHYAVVVGYDLKNGTVMLRSATTRRRVITLAVFERTWSRAGYWGVVIVPPEQIPPTASPLGFLRAAHDLETTGRQDDAATAYRSALLRWPDESAAPLALGNLEYRRGNLRAAESVFREALMRHPQQPELWNNLAYTLAALRCSTEAAAAVRCARQLAPQDQNIINSEREISQWAVDGAAAPVACAPIACPHR